jgi:hypothetical protein
MDCKRNTPVVAVSKWDAQECAPSFGSGRAGAHFRTLIVNKILQLWSFESQAML